MQEEIARLQAANTKLTEDNKMLYDANRSLNSALINVTHQIENVEEREAACCPEDVSFDEYIRHLQEENERLTAHLQTSEEEIRSACMQLCRWCDNIRLERKMVNGFPFWRHCEEDDKKGVNCDAFAIHERRYQRQQEQVG